MDLFVERPSDFADGSRDAVLPYSRRSILDRLMRIYRGPIMHACAGFYRSSNCGPIKTSWTVWAYFEPEFERSVGNDPQKRCGGKAFFVPRERPVGRNFCATHHGSAVWRKTDESHHDI